MMSIPVNIKNAFSNTDRGNDAVQERQLKTESEKFTKLCDEDADKMRSQLDAETGEMLKHHQQHMAEVIGRFMTAHARKQATPSTSLDPTLEKIQVDSLLFFYVIFTCLLKAATNLATFLLLLGSCVFCACYRWPWLSPLQV